MIKKTILSLAQAALLLAVGSAAQAADPSAKISLLGRPLPQVDSLADDHYGQQLATRTFAYLGPEVADRRMRYAGNNLACTSCHQEGATKPYAMPWIGAAATFPQYRGREDDVSTLDERINGCMERSLNGRALPLASREMKALESYIHFLSRGIPVGAEVEGMASKLSKMPNRRANLENGAEVYQKSCVACHGSNGQGLRVGKAGDAQGYTFPPVWGADSFNDGAGMNRLVMATRFIKHNMPQGATHAAPLLSDDEAYDVAAFVLSKPRPAKAGLEKDFPARWNKPIDAPFPPYVDGASADQHRYGPFPPLAELARQRAVQQKALEEARANLEARRKQRQD